MVPTGAMNCMTQNSRRSARRSAMKLRSHGRYDFDPLPSRPAGCWPGGARIAFYVALNLEQYSFGEGLVEDLVPPLGQPDVMNYSWRDWGNRIGAWRLLAMFRELGFAPSLLVNTVLYETAPGLIEAFRKPGLRRRLARPHQRRGTSRAPRGGRDRTDTRGARHDRTPRRPAAAWLARPLDLGNRTDARSAARGGLRLRAGLGDGRPASLAADTQRPASVGAVSSGLNDRTPWCCAAIPGASSPR